MNNLDYICGLDKDQWHKYCERWKHISGIPMGKIPNILDWLLSKHLIFPRVIDYYNSLTPKDRLVLRMCKLTIDDIPITQILCLIDWLNKEHTEEAQKKKVYIAGQISDNPNFRKEFATAEKKLQELGYEPVNPAKYEPPNMPYKYYISRGIIMLSGCDKIYMLKGWQRSPGATLEKHFAETVGIEVMPWTR